MLDRTTIDLIGLILLLEEMEKKINKQPLNYVMGTPVYKCSHPDCFEDGEVPTPPHTDTEKALITTMHGTVDLCIEIVKKHAKTHSVNVDEEDSFLSLIKSLEGLKK